VSCRCTRAPKRHSASLVVLLGTLTLACSPAAAATPSSPVWRISGRPAVVGPGPSFSTGKASVLGGPVWMPPLIDPALALSRSGRLVIAWPGPSGVLAASGQLRSPLPATPTQLAPSISSEDEVAHVGAAINAAGIAVVSWRGIDSEFKREGQTQARLSPAQVSGASSFMSFPRTWQSLPFIEGPVSERCGLPAAPSVAFDSRGDGLAVWAAPVAAREAGGDEQQQVDAAFMPAKTGTWGAPVAISPVRPAIFDLRVVVDAGGGAVAVWGSWANQLPSHGSVFVGGCSAPTLEASLHPAGGRWSHPARLGRDEEEPMVAIRPHGEVLVVWREPGPQQPLSARTATLWRPRWSESAGLEGTEDTDTLHTREVGLASGRGGVTAVSWVQEQRSATTLLEVSSVPGRRWSRPRSIASWRTPPEGSASPEQGGLPTCRHVGEAFLAFDRRDDAIAVWQEGCGPTFTALRKAGGGSWSAARRLVGVATNVSPVFALGARGELVAAWLEPGPVMAVEPFPGKRLATSAVVAAFQRAR
jgi:hypothetical protein